MDFIVPKTSLGSTIKDKPQKKATINISRKFSKLKFVNSLLTIMGFSVIMSGWALPLETVKKSVAGDNSGDNAKSDNGRSDSTK